MQKPHDPGTNVHFLNPPLGEQPHSDVLGTLFDALKQAKEKRQERAADARSANEQCIEGEGNIQLAGEIAPRQSITGNNNIQIGAVQLVVNVMVNIER
ncbi:MAG: hypothetical protein ACREX5_07395 [Achromobacter pestifer]